MNDKTCHKIRDVCVVQVEERARRWAGDIASAVSLALAFGPYPDGPLTDVAQLSAHIENRLHSAAETTHCQLQLQGL